MKNSMIKLALAATVSVGFLASCSKDDDSTAAATVYYAQKDQAARPAINTVFNASADKDLFNTTAPSAQGSVFQSKFLANLVALDGALYAANPSYTRYSTNLLGMNPTALTTTFATDVLTVSTTKPTTYYDGTNLLTGRGLADDVIDISLIVIFGGPDGTKNPGLTSDGVAANDKPFLASFPYEAAPW